MEDSFDNRKAYEQLSRDFKKALREREALDASILSMRRTLAALAASCEDAGIKIERNPEAEYILENSSLPDEILLILRTEWPGWLRVPDNKKHLEKLGYDMRRYTNPLATIHMVIKRLLDNERINEKRNAKGFKQYQHRAGTSTLSRGKRLPVVSG